jgi:hypothetical protein
VRWLFGRRAPRIRKTGAYAQLSAFGRWLTKHPVAGDGLYDRLSVRYQVARYCEYLDANPWPHGDPLRDARQRKRVVDAYAAYLGTFDTPAPTIALVRRSLDRFYMFLSPGPS